MHDYTPEQIVVWSSGFSNIPKWEMRAKEQYFIVARIDQTIVGIASLAPSGDLDLMYVHHRQQGQGIATQMLAALELQARQWSLTEIYVDVSTTARPFFLRYAYNISEYNEKEIRGLLFHNAVMRKRFS